MSLISGALSFRRQLPAKISWFADPAQHIRVSLTIEGSNDLTKAQATKEQLENKKAMVEKLGRVWNVINVVKSIGEALSDVSLRNPPELDSGLFDIHRYIRQ